MSSPAVKIAGLRLANPTILASGVMGSTKSSLVKIAASGAGAVTIKTITREPRTGHKNPTMVEVSSGYLNAMGYCNMGLEAARDEFAGLDGVGVPVIASIVDEEAAGFACLAQEFDRMGFSALEVVLSCPHTPGLGLLAGQGTPDATREITLAVREATKLPLVVKLSPNVMDVGSVAKAAVSAGADALNMGNTLGPGMVIDLKSRTPVLAYRVGGMSGPAVKPVTVRCVYDVYEATGGRTPIIATGGITTGLDAVEAFMAGASAVGVGTAVKYRGVEVFRLITKEIVDWMRANRVESLSEIVGVAHG